VAGVNPLQPPLSTKRSNCSATLYISLPPKTSGYEILFVPPTKFSRSPMKPLNDANERWTPSPLFDPPRNDRSGTSWVKIPVVVWSWSGRGSDKMP